WLERLAAGDLPPDRAAEIRARLAAEPDGEARLAAIARSNRELLDRFSAAEMTRRARAHAERPSPPPLRAPRWLCGAPAAAALAAVLLFVRTPPTAMPIDGPEPTRIKGPPQAPALGIHRQTDRGPERLASGAPAHARDRLQLSYAPGAARYGVL